MKKVQVRLHTAAVRSQLLKGAGTMACLSGIAEGIARRAGDGYEVSPWPDGKNRGNVSVRAATASAQRDCRANNTLLKALR